MPAEAKISQFKPVTKRKGGDPQTVVEYAVKNVGDSKDEIIVDELARLNEDGTVKDILCQPTGSDIAPGEEMAHIYDPAGKRRTKYVNCGGGELPFLPDKIGYIVDEVPQGGAHYGIRTWKFESEEPPEFMPPGESNTATVKTWSVGVNTGLDPEVKQLGVVLLGGVGAGVALGVGERVL